jgi:hypothetical protein
MMSKVWSSGWEHVVARLKVVSLTWLLRLLVPSLLLSTLSRSARGASFTPGRQGLAVGLVLVSTSVVVGWLFGGPLRPEAILLCFWILGTTGTVMIASSVRPLAFVKPICTRCRLLPVIKEHEAIHLSGIEEEKAVWKSMRTRHSIETLALQGDPSICWFCPIPKRLSEH